MIRRYERITLDKEVGGGSFLLRVLGESEDFLRGVEVGIDGDPVSGKGFDERQRIIQKAAIRSRVAYRMDLHYGALVPSST